MPPGTLPRHDRQPGPGLGAAGRGGAQPAPDRLRGVPDHAGQRASCEELAMHKRFRVRTIQAEDEIAAVTAAIGAAFGGAIGVTASSGPGIALKGEAIGLAVTAELPLVVFDIQRGGPAHRAAHQDRAGRPDAGPLRPQQREPGGGPRPATPGDCFYIAYEAVRIAVKYMVPVMVLSDGFLANGSEPWLIPDPKTLPPIDGQVPDRAGGILPVPARSGHAGPPVGPAGHPRPRASHRRHREAGRHRQHLLRPGQPRPHGAHARREGPAGGPGDPAHLDQRAGDGGPAGRGLGRDVRRHHRRRGGGAGRGQVGGVDAPALPEPAAARPRPHPARVPPGAGAGDQQRAARPCPARRVSGRRGRIQPRARPAPRQSRRSTRRSTSFWRPSGEPDHRSDGGRATRAALHEEGLRVRPGRPLVPGVWRLRHPERRSEDDAGPRAFPARTSSSSRASGARAASRTT